MHVDQLFKAGLLATFGYPLPIDGLHQLLELLNMLG
jgi:hypothetical protein